MSIQKLTADELEGLTTFQKLQVIFGNADEVEAIRGTQLFWDWFHDRESYEKKFDANHTERIEQKQAEKEESKACKKKKAGRPRKEPDSPTPSEPKRKRGRPKKTES